MHELFGMQVGDCFHDLPEDVSALLGRESLTFLGLHKLKEISILSELENDEIPSLDLIRTPVGS